MIVLQLKQSYKCKINFANNKSNLCFVRFIFLFSMQMEIFKNNSSNGKDLFLFF